MEAGACRQAVVQDLAYSKPFKVQDAAIHTNSANPSTAGGPVSAEQKLKMAQSATLRRQSLRHLRRQPSKPHRQGLAIPHRPDRTRDPTHRLAQLQRPEMKRCPKPAVPG